MDMKLNSHCDATPEEEAAILSNRNANWLTKMPDIMAQKPTLFAVGAGHVTIYKTMGNRGVARRIKPFNTHLPNLRVCRVR